MFSQVQIPLPIYFRLKLSYTISLIWVYISFMVYKLLNEKQKLGYSMYFKLLILREKKIGRIPIPPPVLTYGSDCYGNIWE